VSTSALQLPFGPLLAISHHVLKPGEGFGMHPHREVVLLTYVLEGEVLHEDDDGNRDVGGPGSVRCVTAGTGIWHSERNASATAPARYVQFWLTPSEPTLTPQTITQDVSGVTPAPDGRRLIASPDGRDGSLRVPAALDVWMGDGVAPGPKTGSPSPAAGTRA
jgi:quercetin 2,3-dioxygenase